MTSFQGYKGRIERAQFDELSDIARQIEADRSLSIKDRIVLDTLRTKRLNQFGSGVAV